MRVYGRLRTRGFDPDQQSGEEVRQAGPAAIWCGGIPRAEFVQLDIRNHIPQEHEPAWRDFNGAVLRFTGQNLRADAGSGCDTLAPRERQILSILRWGWANARIAFELELSERTVRNHISRLYENPGVHSRGETVTLAYEHGFGS